MRREYTPTDVTQSTIQETEMRSNRSSRFYKVLSIFSGIMTVATFYKFEDDRAVGVLWGLSTIVLFYMHLVTRQDREFDE